MLVRLIGLKKESDRYQKPNTTETNRDGQGFGYMNSVAIREQQALDCMASADRFRDQLAGGKEVGMELYQQSLLNCHDAIQRRGFKGDQYEFYLRTAVKNLHRKEKTRQRRLVPFEHDRPRCQPRPPMP